MEGREALPRGLDLISGNAEPVVGSEQDSSSLRPVRLEVAEAGSVSSGCHNKYIGWVA